MQSISSELQLDALKLLIALHREEKAMTGQQQQQPTPTDRLSHREALRRRLRSILIQADEPETSVSTVLDRSRARLENPNSTVEPEKSRKSSKKSQPASRRPREEAAAAAVYAEDEEDVFSEKKSKKSKEDKKSKDKKDKKDKKKDKKDKKDKKEKKRKHTAEEGDDAADAAAEELELQLGGDVAETLAVTMGDEDGATQPMV